ncbi:hypothetical protein RWK44_29415 [Rhizobium sp. 25PS6]|uniref:hypothetical protein n=1 Tax=Rhizobium TaxID=379 RepID=UPI00103B37B9|nr:MULTISPECIES: hypothetical protein [Rhizobium]MBY3184262.1 hypothetical protein [Rhizobium laguerreae]MBY3232640.1 hypothetical protein [Rhizobium laguerreae]MBY3246321.1 hypothetical protein [Rhizobium laguerreae]MBY3252995.1 hypothetical protein [Rhizobium laguerreae]MBY3257131.1 hypothetical protein [Rhizobium laguerreae]
MRKDIDNALPEQPTAAISAAQLLHPARHFNHPRDVLAAGDISKQEKRAILASWASDMFAIESIPALRLYPGTAEAVSYDEIIQALKYLDEDDMRTGEQGLSAACNVQSGHRRRPQARRLGGLGLCSYWKGDRRRQPLEM